MYFTFTLLIARLFFVAANMSRFRGVPVLDFVPSAVVSCHEAWDVDVVGQVPCCAQSGTANCAVALHLIYDASSYQEGQTS